MPSLNDGRSYSSSVAVLSNDEFDRAAVVAIQGGGVFGLSMLGQLSAVVEAGIVPIALSGTSAGAVVAVLVWAGYSPKQIRDMFAELAKTSGDDTEGQSGRETLVDLIGPFGEHPFQYDYSRFRRLADSVLAYLRHFVRSADRASNPVGVELWWRLGSVRRAEAVIGCGFGLFLAVLAFFCWKLSSISTHLLVGLLFASWIVTALFVLRKLLKLAYGIWKIGSEVFAHPWPRRGFFEGGRFETFISEMLRASPKLSPYQDELKETVLTFGRIAELRKNHPHDLRLDFVPLILTVTDLEKRELVLITSYDSKFADFCIAKAVRASAGFPMFFQPIDVTSGSHTGCYVDGGVIANSPAWVFSKGLRAGLSEIEAYRDLATRPWLNIGLRVTNDPESSPVTTTGGFLRAMFDLARGQVRDQLETALASPLPRTLMIEQRRSKTGAPKNILDIHELNHDKIHTMFSLGREFAADSLKHVSFALPDDDDPIREALQKLTQQIDLLLGHDENDPTSLRANVFVPRRDALILRYAWNMDGDPDFGMVLNSNKGLTGRCYSRRRPFLCNLEILREWAKAVAESDPEATKLGMKPADHLTIPEDRSWLMNVPIFDPKDSWFLDEVPECDPSEPDAVWKELKIDRDGAVLGVLNIDSASTYDDSNLQSDRLIDLTDLQVEAIVSLLWACSIDIGRALSRSFAREE